MSEATENIGDEFGTYSVDDEDQLQPEDTLIDDGIEDVLDRGYSPADTDRGSRAYGVTAHEQAGHESIEQRIAQEVADPNSAYGAPFHESILDEERIGGDDPDSIDAEDDWLGDDEVGDQRAGRLVDDGGDHTWGRDVGVDGAGASAEEAAMHILEAE